MDYLDPESYKLRPALPEPYRPSLPEYDLIPDRPSRIETWTDPPFSRARSTRGWEPTGKRHVPEQPKQLKQQPKQPSATTDWGKDVPWYYGGTKGRETRAFAPLPSGTKYASSGVGRAGGRTAGVRRPPPYPTYEAPTPFVAPEWDEEEIASLARKSAAIGLREARAIAQQAIGRHEKTPPLRREKLRIALGEHGRAIGRILTASELAAQSLYRHKYARDIEAARLEKEFEFKATEKEYSAEERAFRVAWSEWATG